MSFGRRTMAECQEWEHQRQVHADDFAQLSKDRAGGYPVGELTGSGCDSKNATDTKCFGRKTGYTNDQTKETVGGMCGHSEPANPAERVFM